MEEEFKKLAKQKEKIETKEQDLVSREKSLVDKERLLEESERLDQTQNDERLKVKEDLEKQVDKKSIHCINNFGLICLEFIEKIMKKKLLNKLIQRLVKLYPDLAKS